MVYTSYYGNWRKFPEGKTLVSVSFHHPDHFPNLHKTELRKLFPPFQLVMDYKNGKVSEEEYTEKYLTHLNSQDLNWNKAIEKLQDCILLCYCKKGQFCHRHIIAGILREHGAEVEEI